MRHVPIVQPTSGGQPVAGSVGTGFADCEGSATLGGGFVLGEGDAMDVVQSSRPRMSGFRPIGWEVTVRPSALGDGAVNDGTFAYALCLKGNATALP